MDIILIVINVICYLYYLGLWLKKGFLEEVLIGIVIIWWYFFNYLRCWVVNLVENMIWVFMCKLVVVVYVELIVMFILMLFNV